MKGSSIRNTNNEKTPKLVRDVNNENESSLKVCPYLIKGYCKFRTKCKDLHPAVNGNSNEKSKIQKIRRCRYDNVGCGNENCKYRHDNPTFSNNSESHLTESEFLRQTEIQQLQKRFRGEKCVIVAEGPPTNFIVTFEPTDPDWVSCFVDCVQQYIETFQYLTLSSCHFQCYLVALKNKLPNFLSLYTYFAKVPSSYLRIQLHLHCSTVLLIFCIIS